MGLLDQITKHLADLNPELVNAAGGVLDYGKKKAKYIGGLLDDNSEISRDLQGWHKKTQLGLADQLAGRKTPEAEYAYNQLMNMAGVAPLGMIAWHGSPHKFDKFSLDKIGTGEGAQAYGHGLYLAESPQVAQQYQHNLTANQLRFDGKPIEQLSMIERDAADYATRYGGKQQALDVLNDNLQRKSKFDDLDYMARVKERLAAADFQKPEGALYKTDIPDEAVARFLDWDKSVAEQSPEVQKAIRKIAQQHGENIPLLGESLQPFELKNTTGQSIYSLLSKGGYETAGNKVDATELLKQAGVPGIRYLDGGSRGAGNGTSNFVSFDPDMIRILERNGVPTGEKPWTLGEWQNALQAR